MGQRFGVQTRKLVEGSSAWETVATFDSELQAWAKYDELSIDGLWKVRVADLESKIASVRLKTG